MYDTVCIHYIAKHSGGDVVHSYGSFVADEVLHGQTSWSNHPTINLLLKEVCRYNSRWLSSLGVYVARQRRLIVGHFNHEGLHQLHMMKEPFVIEILYSTSLCYTDAHSYACYIYVCYTSALYNYIVSYYFSAPASRGCVY